MSAVLTIFSTPKPFTNPQVAMIQSNAIDSWLHLGQQVDVLLIGEEEGVAAVAKKKGIRLIREVARNSMGTPLVSSIFRMAVNQSQSPLLVYVNADILLTPAFTVAALQVMRLSETFLMVGRRWDLEIQKPLDFSSDWVEQLNQMVAERAKLHPTGGSDYFVFPRDCFTCMPDLAVGRAGWDNWMIYEARRKGWPVVDASPTYRVVHQQHDYSHLPGGQPHYRHPESNENVRLAGGRHTIYTLADTTFELRDGRLEKRPLTWKRFWREVEIAPVTILNWPPAARFSHVFFHPIRAYWAFRVWFSNKRRRLRY